MPLGCLVYVYAALRPQRTKQHEIKSDIKEHGALKMGCKHRYMKLMVP